MFWAGPQKYSQQTTSARENLSLPFTGKVFYSIHLSMKVWKNIFGLSDFLRWKRTKKPPKGWFTKGFFTPDIMKYLKKLLKSFKIGTKGSFSGERTCSNSQTKREKPTVPLETSFCCHWNQHPPRAMPTPRKKALFFGTFF